MKSLIVTLALGMAITSVTPALAAKRSDFTKAQQKVFYNRALKACRKQFGASLHEVKVDYAKKRFVCRYYG